jgi:lysophospholipase L1-like esterase
MSFPLSSKLLLITLAATCAVLVMVWRNRDDWENKYHNLQKLPNPLSYRYSENPNYSEYEDLAQLYTSSKKIVFLGTSRTARIQWDELLQRSDIDNAGVGSDITEGLLHRLTLLYPKKPEIVFLECGINDIVLGLPAEQVITSCKQLVDSLQQHQIRVVLQTVIPVTKAYKGSLRINEGVFLFNQFITRLATQKNCTLIDITSAVSEHGFLQTEFAQTDGIHLSASAYQLWKQQITPLLTP